MLTFFQMIVVIMASVPMINLNNVIHRPAQYLPSIQEKYRGFLVTREKLAMLSFYESVYTLETGNPIGLTVGPLGILTRFKAVKGLIFYIIYTLFSLSVVEKNFEI